MKLLHVTPHLGGGVGKAHAAMRGAMPAEIEQTFVLLEQQRDRRYVQLIENGGDIKDFLLTDAKQIVVVTCARDDGTCRVVEIGSFIDDHRRIARSGDDSPLGAS